MYLICWLAGYLSSWLFSRIKVTISLPYWEQSFRWWSKIISCHAEIKKKVHFTRYNAHSRCLKGAETKARMPNIRTMPIASVRKSCVNVYFEDIAESLASKRTHWAPRKAWRLYHLVDDTAVNVSCWSVIGARGSCAAWRRLHELTITGRHGIDSKRWMSVRRRV